MKKNLNINVNKDDFGLNDYLFAWEYFNERPSKIIFYEPIDFDTFQEFLSNYNYFEQCTLTEVFPIGDTNVKNKKVTLKIDENIFISYTHFDSENEDNIVSEITVLHSSKAKEIIEDFTQKFESLLLGFEEDDSSAATVNNTFSLTLTTSGLEINPVKFIEIDKDNFELYYNKKTFKQVKKLTKILQTKNKGLSLIYGERGTGKTSLVNYISSKVEKTFIFIPCTLFETIVLSPEFRTFLTRHKNSIIVLDDSDIYFSEIYSKSNIFTNNIIQLVDGLDSDDYNVQIVALLNVKDVEQIDHTLLDCNNLNDVIMVDALEKEKITSLCKHLKIKNKFSNTTVLRNVLTKRQDFTDTKDIGFI